MNKNGLAQKQQREDNKKNMVIKYGYITLKLSVGATRERKSLLKPSV